MSLDPATVTAILAMAAATFGCRIGGYLVMRFVPITPFVERVLRDLPGALFVAILVPQAVAGGAAIMAGIAVTAAVMWVWGQDLPAILGGTATVALWRALVGG